MELNLQLTRQTKILIGILAIVLIIAIATQWGPGLYGLISNPAMEAKRQTLETSKDLVTASKILKPVEPGLYQKTGLADKEKTDSIFDGNFPETIIREKIDAIVKEAGIPRNYQLNLEPVPGKKSEKISPQARRNLVVLLYQKKLETERDTLNAEIEAAIQAEMEAEEPSIDMLMDAWLDETDEDTEKLKKSEKSDENHTDSGDLLELTEKEDAEEPEKPQESEKNQTDSEKSVDTASQWEFASLPEAIPSSMRIELIELIVSMIGQHLVGAEKTLFENQFYKTQKEATSGFFGIGAKKPTTEINFHPNSQILAKFTNLIDVDGGELNKEKLTTELLEYLELIQSQIAELSKKLQLAPTTYSPESYTVKIKFKAEIDKLVKLNRLIETKTKWLMVRDLQISVDNKQNKINVDVLMIARAYQ